VSKKADHSVLRLLQISQQHIESQLDRVRHERELWKEVVDKRSQQPLQLALTLKDPHTGQPIANGPPGYALPGQNMGMMTPGFPTSRPLPEIGAGGDSARMASGGAMDHAGGLAGPGDVPTGAMKASPLAKRIARPPQGGLPPPAKA